MHIKVCSKLLRWLKIDNHWNRSLYGGISTDNGIIRNWVTNFQDLYWTNRKLELYEGLEEQIKEDGLMIHLGDQGGLWAMTSGNIRRV